LAFADLISKLDDKMIEYFEKFCISNINNTDEAKFLGEDDFEDSYFTNLRLFTSHTHFESTYMVLTPIGKDLKYILDKIKLRTE
jgi:hypothetical protein